MSKYEPVGESDIPENVRFDVPKRNDGQHVEVAYGGFSRYEHDDGAPFKRVTDLSKRVDDPERVVYYRAAP